MASKPQGGEGCEDSDMWERYNHLRRQMIELLSGKLSNNSVIGYRETIEIRNKCSYYINIVLEDQHRGQLDRFLNLHSMIDPSKYLLMKEKANCQIRIQLCLLEMLYGEIRRGKEILEQIMNTYEPMTVVQDSASIQQRLDQVNQTLLDMDSVLLPGHLYVQHKLIPVTSAEQVPDVRLVFDIKMPVTFRRDGCRAQATSVQLRWHVQEHERYGPTEHFEVRYTLLNPNTAEEQQHTGPITTYYFSMQIGDLFPERSYEFSLKRVQASNLVYDLWTDTLMLTTMSLPAGSAGSKT
nr:fibronectin type III domain-containing protein 11 [Paramormyrops kingsleyae]XP_023651239.1 fibronectin type III domain-containing protein 11 [Paramormyrops kingsleyae]XP_023651240.1 fibronectin type III domain-containing protein 11 [Paramormyrops kingsleyae]XP_023651242.1 fibronectin type III domain-containing protein 11 [Paramormyrops kingsleyae]